MGQKTWAFQRYFRRSIDVFFQRLLLFQRTYAKPIEVTLQWTFNRTINVVFLMTSGSTISRSLVGFSKDLCWVLKVAFYIFFISGLPRNFRRIFQKTINMEILRISF